MAHENTLTLNGQSLYTVGPVTGQSIAEFNAGFKIGKATYDDREHAFFLPLDDFSAGIGSRRIDIHESLGGYWDGGDSSIPAGGVDVRRPGHLTLPPLRTTQATISAPGAMPLLTGGDLRALVTSDVGGTNFLYLGAGNKIWRLATDRVTMTDVATLQAAGPARVSANVNTIVEWLGAATSYTLVSLTRAGTVATATTSIAHGLAVGDLVVISGASNANYNGQFTITAVTATTFTYTVTNSGSSPDPNTVTYLAPGRLRLFAFTIGQDLTSRYWYTPDGANWVEGSRTVWEAVVWDNKLVGSMPLPFGGPYGPQGMIVCGFSADGLTWNIDQVSGGLDTSLNGSGARPKFVFQTLPHWIGVANAPWGGTTPYFIDNGKLYALDFYKETAVLIQEVGDKARITCGGVFEGYVWASDGYNVWIYDPGGANTVRRVGMFGPYGAPPSLQGFTVATFIGGTSTLYAVLVDNLNNYLQIMAWNGSGWTELGPRYTSRVLVAGVVDGIFPALSPATRYLDLLTNTAQFATSIHLDSFALPVTGDVPIEGNTTFDPGPDVIITGWYDGGFIDLLGALHRMYIDGWNITATETVKVEYQLDQAETSAWTTLGTFTTNNGTIWFDATNHRGVKFRTVRFRITFARGATTTATPEVVALVLVYDKKPEFRSMWNFRIDTNLMIEEKVNVTNSLTSLTEAGTTATAVTQYPHGFADGDSVTIAGAADAKYNGTFTVTVVNNTTFTYTTTAGATSPDTSTSSTWTAPATTGRIWSALKTIFDTKTLVPLVIPNIEASWSPGLNVRIVDMPLSVDDYRDSVKGLGYLEIKVLQPVGINQ